jgi:propionyl-CoA synthetase
MEAVVASHDSVAECCVVGVEDALRGEVPVAFVLLKDDNKKTTEQVQKEIVHLIRKNIGPLASLKSVCVCKRLPKTRSGKILRYLQSTTMHSY